VVLAEYPAPDGFVPEIAFTPQNELAVFGIVDERTAVLWRSSHAEPLSILTMDKDMLLKSAALSPDAKTLTIGRSDGGIELHRTSDGARLFTIQAHSDWVLDMAFSPDGKLLASTSLSFDPTVKIWRVSNGVWVGTPENKKWDFGAVSFSPEGSLLASFSTYGTRLWGVGDLRLRAEIPAWGVLSGDGRLFAALTEATVAVWDTGGLLKQTHPRDAATSLEFSPDGAALALGMGTGQVVLWQISP
jgi:WD40 repeat protein